MFLEMLNSHLSEFMKFVVAKSYRSNFIDLSELISGTNSNVRLILFSPQMAVLYKHFCPLFRWGEGMHRPQVVHGNINVFGGHM